MLRPRTIGILVLAHALALSGGWLTGLAMSRDMPGIDNLDVMNLPRRTVVRDRNDVPVHTFAEQQRIPVGLTSVSPWYLKAIVATEDPRFESHIGVDLLAVLRAALATVRSMDFGVEGASTITMQLARLQFLHPKKTLSRKIQEALLATQIERHYSKEEILALYCNRIYLGHGTYGVESASRYYFGKSARALDLPEAALLAGVTQMPERLTPFRHPDRALRRRNYVLQRMVSEGLLDAQTATLAQNTPLTLSDRTPVRDIGPYFIEQVRRIAAREFGQAALYREGLVIRTTLDPKMQRAAELAVARGLDAYGRRHGQRPRCRPLPDDVVAAEFVSPTWHARLELGEIVEAVIEAVENETVRVRVADRLLDLTKDAYSWTGARIADELFSVDRVIDVAVVEVDQNGVATQVELASDPTPQAALIAMDAVTGQVRAMVGGRDFRTSEFNRALQAKRQAGSAFKPFIYAAALERGFLPNDLIPDRPAVLVDPGADEPYQPENFERDYEGTATLRHALEHSRNIPTVRLLDAIGYEPAVAIARRLGIATELKPYPSLALGAFEVDLAGLVAAYAAFVNGGILVTPRLIERVDRIDGTPAWIAPNDAVEVLAPEIAAMVSSMLEGVILHGTGRKAKVLGRPVGGKTGTTDGFTDAWFVGFTPTLAVGVWVGHDKNETLGRTETGAKAALPIWIDFLDHALTGETVDEFLRPPGVRRTVIDAETGRALRREAGCRRAVLESFPVGREFPSPCDERQHLRRDLPYPLARYVITKRLELLIEPAEAAALVARAGVSRMHVAAGGGRLVYSWGGETGSIPLNWTAADWDVYIRRLPIELEVARLRVAEREQFFEEWEAAEKLRAEEEAARGIEPDPSEPEAEPVVPAHLRRGVDGWPAEVVPVHRGLTVRWPALPIDP